MKFLAFDTSTDAMSVALTDGERVWEHTGAGGAKASSTLIPAILALLADAGLALGDLDAIVFGRGPGSFTGLRTACAVAQGLALGANAGAGIPVLPVDTLMALAEEARILHATAFSGPSPLQVVAVLDARMDEVYVQRFAVGSDGCTALDACVLVRPEDLGAYVRAGPAAALLAGNVFEVYAGRLEPGLATSDGVVRALPTARALLQLAPALAAAGHCVDAALALPLYVRDKVALTTEEREQVKAQKAEAAVAAVAADLASPD
ncbi:MAG: peptidase glycoprotease [Polaromonas sp.]|nr:peptidase glycoprotease [Polaromonas sp.]